MQRFVHTALPARVVFGRGSSGTLAQEVQQLGLKRVLVLSTPGKAALAQRLAKQLGPLAAGIHPHAVMHVPAAVVDVALQAVAAAQADGIVAAGGGSTIGLGKAIALESGLPQIAVPTTYAGSEMTPIWGLTRDGVKTTGRSTTVLPKTVIYDADLSDALPAATAAVSGMNAIAHCVEGLYAPEVSPLISLMAEEGIRALAASLPRIVRQADDKDAREQALYGAWLAGSVLGLVGMALHHKLCHTLGGSFDLPHAEVHSVMIAQVTAFNAPAAPDAMARIARALGSSSAAAGLYELATRLQIPQALRDLGMRADDLDRAAELATRNPYYNPRELTRDNVRALLQAAWEGTRPA